MKKNDRSSVAMPLALALIAACGGAASSPPPDRSAAKEEPATTSFKAPAAVEPSATPAPSQPPPPESKAEEPAPKPASNASDALWAEAKREQQEDVDAAVVRLDAEVTKLERTKQPWTVNEVNKTAETGNTIIDLRKRSEDARLKALWSRWGALRAIAARTQNGLVAQCKAERSKNWQKCRTSLDDLRDRLRENGCYQHCRAIGEEEETCFARCATSLEERTYLTILQAACLVAAQGGTVEACDPR